MRSLFILLVVLNIGYLIWGMAFSEKNLAEAPQTLTQGLQTLTLLSEKPEDGVQREDIDLSSKRKIKITKSDSDLFVTSFHFWLKSQFCELTSSKFGTAIAIIKSQRNSISIFTFANNKVIFNIRLP